MTRDGTTTSAFLDLAVLPEVGSALLDPRPAWLWRADGARVLWANTAGMEWFGAASAAELASRGFPRRVAATGEIAELAATLPTGESRLTVLHLPQGVTLQPLACTCRALVLPGGKPALLVIATGEDAGRVQLAAAARDLLPILGSDAEAIAVFDGDGALLTHSSGYAELAAFAGSIDSFIDDFLAGVDRRARHTIVAADGTTHAVQLARVGSALGDLLILVVGEAGPVEPSHPAVETMDDLAGWRPAAESVPRPPPRSAVVDEAGIDTEPIGPTVEPDAPAAEPPPSLHPAVPRHAGPGPSPTPSAEPAPPGPVRFAWEMDADTRFTLVSPEFADAIGPAAATLVGRSWDEVAAAFGLDADGSVARALAGQDSWSGLTIVWPTGDGGRVSVDLAALPAFSRDHAFAGYRGFGICRFDVPAPERSETVAPDGTDDAVAGPDAADLPVEPESATDAGAPADRSSNIVRLRGAGGDPVLRAEALSGLERDAFRKIAEELGVSRGSADDAAVDEAASADVALSASRPGEAALDARLLDRLPVGIIVFREAVTLFVNRAALELLGYGSREEFAAAGGVATVFPGNDSDWTGEPGEQLRARRRDRTEITVRARLNSTPWGDGLALLLSLSPADADGPAAAPPVGIVPERDDVVAADDGADGARIAELEAILDTATDGVVLIDGLGLILSLNRSAQALFGIDAAAAIGKPFAELLAEESRKSALDYLDGLARNGVASLLNDGREVIGKVPSGGLIPLFMTIGRLGDSGKFCAVLRDITQWKNAEEELVNARRQAEVANSQKSEFLAKISHEIRTPLNAVIGFSEVMMEERFGPIGNDRYRGYLRDIHLSGTHLMSLINDLLDLSKIEAGKLDLKFEQVGLNTVIQECVALMQPEANRERIIIRTSLSVGLPDVVADRRSLRQIVLNLLSNAIKFTQPGGQVIVSTTAEESGEVTIRIRDTGIGMSEKQITTALMPFRQVERSDRETAPGTGLGLPLTKALVEANRASFAIESAVDEGTLIRITFPVTRVLAG